MEKIVFDSFQPTDGCYERAQEDAQAKDSCKVEVDFHEQGKPDIPNSTVLFQRQKTKYVVDVRDSGLIPKLNEWGIKEESTELQDKLRSAVQLNFTLRKFMKNDGLGDNAALLSAGTRMIDFLVSGDLFTPDALQRKNEANLLKDILTLPASSQKWLMDFHKIIKESPYSLAAMEPRLQWLSDQVKLHDSLLKIGESYPDEALKAQEKGLSLRTLVSLHSGQEKPDLLEKEWSALALNLSKTPGAADPFAAQLKLFDPLLKETYFKSNADSRKNLVEWVRRLKIAVNEHRFELYGLAPEAAFRRHLTYQLQEAAEVGALASQISKEMDYQGIPASDLKKEFAAWAKKIPTYLSFHPTGGTIPRVYLNTAGLLAEVRKGGTESQLAALASLRYLFGKNFAEPYIDAWFGGQMTKLELEISIGDQEKFKQTAKTLMPKEKSGTNIPRDVILPIAHGTVMAGGIALLSYGIVKKDEYEPRQNPFFHGGIGAIGFGAGALTSNLAWKHKNAELQFLVDTLFGLAAGGAAAGLSFIPSFGRTPDQPPDDPLGHRNPNTPGGGGSCQPPDGGCGP